MARHLAPFVCFIFVGSVIATRVLADQPADNDLLNKSPDAFQHMIDFIVTMNLGAFAAIGYIVKDSKLTACYQRLLQLFFMIAAFCSCAASLIYAYFSYTDLLAMTGNGAFVYDRLRYYPASAFYLALATPFILATLIVTTLSKAP